MKHFILKSQKVNFKLPKLPKISNNLIINNLYLGKLINFKLPKLTLSYLKQKKQNQVGLVRLGKDKVSNQTPINKGIGKIGKIFNTFLFRKKILITLFLLIFSFISFSCVPVDTPEPVQITVLFDGEDNLFKIDNQEYKQNLNLETNDCYSNEICFKPKDRCTILITSDKYQFITASSLDNRPHNIEVQGNNIIKYEMFPSDGCYFDDTFKFKIIAYENY